MNSRYTKAVIIIAACIAFLSSSANQTVKAQQSSENITLNNGAVISNASLNRIKDQFIVSFDVDFTGGRAPGWQRIVQVVPSVAGEADTLKVASLSVYGRSQYYIALRNKQEMVSSEYDRAWRWSEAPKNYHFEATIKYEPWMKKARLLIEECTKGCCGKIIGNNLEETPASYTQPTLPVYTPNYIYLRPKADIMKMRALKATSFIDFPVSRTEIYPDYRNNPRELAKILSTIDSVKNDKDLTIHSITLKGFASPESPYTNNYRLAKGRTESLKSYVASYEHIPSDLIQTTFEPENWEGLREYVEASDISNKQGLLALINNYNYEPDLREAKIKKTYPEEYKFLLKNCYPGLRKVDYQIDYKIRVYTDIEEIRAAFRESPSKLSLEEFYVLALSYPEDSKEFHEVIKTAIEYYPKDYTSNLNAANVAMSEDRMKEAGSYLDKAGDSYEAIYARGIYNAKLKNYERALSYFKQIKEEIPAAQEAITTINNILTISEMLK